MHSSTAHSFSRIVAIARDRNRAGSNRHTIPFSVPLRFWRPNGHGEKGRTVPIARIRVLPQYEAMMLRGASTAALAIFLVIITYAVYRSDDRANLNYTYDKSVVNEMRRQMEP